MKTICIAGKNDIAVNILQHCIKTYPDYKIVCLTNRTESGKNTWQKSLLWYAKKHSIDICELDDVYNIKDLIFLSAEYDRIIIPEKFMSVDLYNIHFSLLPKYKGFYTSVFPILNGDKQTGVTLHKIRRGVDTGEIIDQEAFDIKNEYSCLDVYNKLIEVGTKVLIRNISSILDGSIDFTPQSVDGSTYISKNKIDYSNLQLDVRCTAYQIRNQIRAFNFRPYQLIKWNSCFYVDAEVLEYESVNNPGTIIEDNDIYTIISSIDFDIKMYKDVLKNLLDAIGNYDNLEAKRLCACQKIIESKDSHGWSPLTVAVYCNNFVMVEYLVDRGADINVLNNNGTTLLMYSKDAGIKTGDWSIMKYLIQRGLDVTQADYNDKRLIDYIDEVAINKIPNEIKKYLFK